MFFALIKKKRFSLHEFIIVLHVHWPQGTETMKRHVASAAKEMSKLVYVMEDEEKKICLYFVLIL